MSSDDVWKCPNCKKEIKGVVLRCPDCDADSDKIDAMADRLNRLPKHLKKLNRNNVIVQSWIHFYADGDCGYVEMLESLVGAMAEHTDSLIKKLGDKNDGM